MQKKNTINLNIIKKMLGYSLILFVLVFYAAILNAQIAFPASKDVFNATNVFSLATVSDDIVTTLEQRPAGSFPDVIGPEYASVVKVVSDFKIMNGSPDGNFYPYQSITRAEFSKVITEMMDRTWLENVSQTDTPFPDVPAGHWAIAYINAVNEHGIMKGDGSNFLPEDPLNYQEVLTILVRCLGYEKWIDAELEWPFNYVQKALNLNLTDGFDYKTGGIDLDFEYAIGLTRPVPRGDVARLIVNALNVPNPYYGTSLKLKRNPTYDHLPENEKSLEELALLEDSVVFIQIYADPAMTMPIGSGSGVLFNNDMILTNAHILDGNPRYGITFSYMDKTQEYGLSSLLYLDQEKDIAILYAPDDIADTIQLGPSSALKKGEKIFTIGSPIGIDYRNSVSDGIVSGLIERDGKNYIQFTAPISHGSSGGALINSYGELVGITSNSVIEGENMNLAIPIDDIITSIHDQSIFNLELNFDLLNLLNGISFKDFDYYPDLTGYYHKDYDEFNLEWMFFEDEISDLFNSNFQLAQFRTLLEKTLESGHSLLEEKGFQKHLITIRTQNNVYQYRYQNNEIMEIRNSFLKNDVESRKSYEEFAKYLLDKYQALNITNHTFPLQEIDLSEFEDNTNILQMFLKFSLSDYLTYLENIKKKQFKDELTQKVLELARETQLNFPAKDVETILWHYDTYDILPEEFEPDFYFYDNERAQYYCFKYILEINSLIQEDYMLNLDTGN